MSEYIEPTETEWNPDCTWQQALEINHGDYAYGPQGEMIRHEDDGTYTVITGDLDERGRLDLEDIPGALQDLGVSAEGWSYE